MLGAKHPDLAQLRDAVAVFDSLDLVARAAALQLVPENVDRLVRLYGAVGVAATITPSADRPRMSANKWRRFLNEPPLSDSAFASGEDPLNNPFAEVLTFHGGSHVVFPGVDDDACFVFRHLSKAVSNPRDPLPEPDFVEAARALCAFALILSDEIASRADLDRQFDAVTDARGPVYTPGPEEIQSIIEPAWVPPQEVMSEAHKDLRDAMAPPG
jgi:hypothetical protein